MQTFFLLFAVSHIKGAAPPRKEGDPMTRIAIIILLFVASAFAQGNQQADMILFNGKIVTVDSQFSIAQAIAIRGGVIQAVGANQAVQAMAGPNTRRVDLRGKTVTPGFIDGHPHLFAMDSDVPLEGARSVRDMLQ